MAYDYNNVEPHRPTKSNLDLSHQRTFTADMGKLYPIFNELCNPNEDFKINLQHVIRFNPLIHPLMHNVDVYFHFFFVPLRLIHNIRTNVTPGKPGGNLIFEEFITGGADGTGEFSSGNVGTLSNLKVNPGAAGGLSSDHSTTFPQLGPGSLWDFFCYPVAMGEDYLGEGNYQLIRLTEATSPINSCYLAYDMIYWYYYRDELLPTEGQTSTDPNRTVWSSLDICNALDVLPDATMTSAFLNRLMPRPRAYPKDYFTSAQPNAQRGVPGVLSTQGFLDIEYQGVPDSWLDNSNNIAAGANSNIAGGALSNTGPTSPAIPSGTHLGINAGGALFDVNSLILAYSMQNYGMINQHFGTRYTEWMYGQFNQVSEDSRLQRPEYIGGSYSYVSFSEVLQTSASTDPETNALGDLGGHGMAVSSDFIGSYHTPEYGVILGLMSVMPRSSYGQGINRQWIKNSKYDFYVPAFAYIGEQGIFNAEIYGVQRNTDPSPPNPEGIFGYQGAWDEYRTRYDKYNGLMLSSLSSWHLGRIFGRQPNLNQDFINTSRDDWTRAFTFTDEPQLLCELNLGVTAKRPLPYLSIPHIDGAQD